MMLAAFGMNPPTGSSSARATLSVARALSFGIVLLTNAARADPLTDALAANGGSLCYERVYSAEHLSKNPQQATASLLLSLTTDAEKERPVTLRARFEGKMGQQFAVAECRWNSVVNRTVQGAPILPAFKRKAGIECMTMVDADASSAEEGSYALIQILPKDRIMLYLDDNISAWPSLDRSKDAAFIDLGQDDRIFALAPTEAAACEAMDAALPPWWKLLN